MNQRPKICSEVLVQMSEKLPKRIIRRLEKNPQVAEGWEWSSQGDVYQVQTNGEDIVTLKTKQQTISNLEEINCTCLLAPRCFHCYAVVSTLELATETAVIPKNLPQNTEVEASSEVTSQQQEAAQEAFQIFSQALALGAKASGVLVEAQMIRLVTRCKNVGLHQLADITTFLIYEIRRHKNPSANGQLEVLTELFSEALYLSYRLSSAQKDEEGWLGVSRRSYQDLPSQKLHGIFSTPIQSDTGFSGITTWFCNEKRELYSITTVSPVQAEKNIALAIYNSPPNSGKLSLSHRKMSRYSIFLQQGQASPEGRLGQGKNVKMATGDSCNWDSDALNSLWKIPVHEQVEKILDEKVPQERQWLFLEGWIQGSDKDCLIFELYQHTSGKSKLVPLFPSYLQKTFYFVTNFRMLQEHPRRPLRIVARIDGDRLVPFALGPSVNLPENTIRLPEHMSGHCNLGMEEIKKSFFHKTEEHKESTIPDNHISSFPEPVEDYQRFLRGVCLGGSSCLTTITAEKVQNYFRKLEHCMMPIGAELLWNLFQKAQQPKRNTLGYRVAPPVTDLSLAWLQASCYLTEIEKEMKKDYWRIGRN